MRPRLLAPTSARPRALASTIVLAAAISSGVLVAPAAHADAAGDLARARAEFHEAVALETAGNWSAALAKLRGVAAVKMTAQVRFHLALCEEHLGRLVAALGDYDLAAHEAEEASNASVATTADEHMKALAPRVPRLTVKRGAGAETATLQLDGVALGQSAVGRETRVDPGKHVVSAAIRGEERAREEVDLAEGESRTVEIGIDAPEGAVAAARPAARPRRPAKPPAEPEKPAEKRAPGAPAEEPSSAGYWLIGAGGASLLAGGVFWSLRSGTLEDLDAKCVDGRCPASSESTASRGKLYTGLGELAFVAGAGLAAAGVWLTLKAPSTAPDAAKSNEALLFGVLPAPGGAAATLRSTF